MLSPPRLRMQREPRKVSLRLRQTRRFPRRTQKMQIQKQNTWANISSTKEKTHSFWLRRPLNQRRRNPPTRASRGLDFVILETHLRPNMPNGMGMETGPRGENGKNKCVSVYFLFSKPLPSTPALRSAVVFLLPEFRAKSAREKKPHAGSCAGSVFF